VLFLDQDFIDEVWDIVYPGQRADYALDWREDVFRSSTEDVNKRIRNAEVALDYERYGESYAEKAAAAREVLPELKKELAGINERNLWKSFCPVQRKELADVSANFEVRRTDYRGNILAGTADVQLDCHAGHPLRIEIKPSMGDDYPSVLRQMKASGCNVLYLGHYAGSGATLDQVRKMFAASGIRILLH